MTDDLDDIVNSLIKRPSVQRKRTVESVSVSQALDASDEEENRYKGDYLGGKRKHRKHRFPYRFKARVPR